MFKSYVKTALRNLLRDRSSSLLNIAGLTLGITCSLILFLLVKYLATFDDYHVNRDRIFRVVTEMDGNNERFYTSGVPAVLPDAFRQDFAEAKEVTFTSYRQDAMISIPQPNGGMTKYNEEGGVVFAEPNFFKIFDRAVIQGSVNKGLDGPNEAVIARSLAKKYFGREEVIGEIVKYDTIEFIITSVMEDHPENTDFPFTLMLSMATIEKAREAEGWKSIWSDEHCYVLLENKEAVANVRAGIPAFVDKYLGKENYRNQTFNLQPLSEVHFDERFSNYSNRTAPREMLVALGIIALFLILTACINFVNLTTAEAVKRSKEVGIRKSLGSTRMQLVAQFLGETTIITVLAMVLSLGITQLLLAVINPFLALSLRLDFSHDLLLWTFVVGVTAFVSLLSGLYPSLVLSGFKPALALKNRINNRSSSGFNLRRSLVVVQFVISQFFIIGTIVLVLQMNYFQSQDLGFRQDAVVLVPIPRSESPSAVANVRTLRDEISRLAGVESASLSSTPPSSGSVSSTGFYFEGEDETQRRDTQVKEIDNNYLPLYDIEIVAGTNLPDYDTATGFLVNEELVRVAGFMEPGDIIGKTMLLWGRQLPVVGVVKDFHTVSLRDKIQPLVLMNNVRGYRNIAIRVNQSQLQSLIPAVKEKWEQVYAEHIFDYTFMDETVRSFYEGEKKMSLLLTIFTSMAIFIGCLGLFGLATFMANQKTKEIGVRKALGASVESIILLFSREYIKLILIGFALSAPAAWWLMNKWLENFAYKISIGPLVFIAGLGVTLIIATLTVGYRSFKAAVVNPIKSLRYE